MQSGITSPVALEHGVSGTVLIHTAIDKPFIDHTIPAVRLRLDQQTSMKHKLLSFGINSDDNRIFTAGNYMHFGVLLPDTLYIQFARHGVPKGMCSPSIDILIDAIRYHRHSLIGRRLVIRDTAPAPVPEDCFGGPVLGRHDHSDMLPPTKNHLIATLLGRNTLFEECGSTKPDGDAIIFPVYQWPIEPVS